MVNLHRMITILLLFLLPAIAIAQVTVTVDRTVIEEGETFQLKIVADEGEPDIRALSHDFDVLSTAKSAKVSITNGSVQRMNELILHLAPKGVGTFVIPSIKSGKDFSLPITLKVVPPSFSQAQQGADVFLEAKTDILSAYVQSQIIYTIRLFRAVELREGSLTEPELVDAVIERLGEDVTFQARRDGRLYHVTERRFAIFPQKSGEFTIASTVFQGQVFDNAARQRTNDPFDRFFQNQRTKRVRVKSEAIHINVQPEPAGAKGDSWLPAKRLILFETWTPESPEFKVGEPVTRTLRIEAYGLTAAQLPELKPFEANGVKQYADQPIVETVLQNGQLIGVREEKFAIVPTQSGKLILPELRLYWWNTEMNQQAFISIPPKIIDVLPAEVTKVVDDSANMLEEDSASDNTRLINKETLKTVVEAGGYWPLIAIAAIIAWLLTALGWLIYWRKKRCQTGPDIAQAKPLDLVSLKSASKQLKQACDRSDATEAKKALLHWAKAAWPDEVSPNLSFLLENIQTANVRNVLSALNEQLYASNEKAWDGAIFWETIKPQLNITQTRSTKKEPSLPSLYPQNADH